MTTAERFMALFATGTSHHGTYDVPEGTEPDAAGKVKGKALTIPTPVTLALVEAHLRGEHGLGITPVRDDGTVLWGALDVDAYIGFDIAALLEKSSNLLNLPLTICKSKSSGAHLFLFAAEPVSRAQMQDRLAECRDALGLPGETEIFPKKSGEWLNAPFFGGTRYSIMPFGEPQNLEDFLTYAEAAKLPASFFTKPVAYMQAPGATKKKKAKKEPPAYTNLAGGHYPEAQSEMARFVGLNNGQLTDAEIDAHVLAELEKMGVTDPAKRREYIEEIGRFGRKIRDLDKAEPRKVDLQILCADFHFFNAGSMQDGFVQFTRGGHSEVWPEERIENLLVARYLDVTGKAPKREELNSVMDGVRARCMTGPRKEIHSRIARTPGVIYLDLCNKNWEAVQIDKDGWRVISNPPVYFRRSNEAKELPVPVSGGSIEELRPLLNAGDDDQWMLMVGWLVGIFQPEGAFSHIALEGGEGVAKTTTANNLIGIVDPNEAGLSGPPKNQEDLSLIAMSSAVVGFDNFSGCRPEMSDIFCRFSTGEAFRTRTLYKNREITSIKIKMPVLVNGIDSIVMRGDLLRRTIVVHLPVIDKENRRTDKDVAQSYREAHPAILGALLDAVSCGLKNLATTKVTNPPSMADFAHWIKACEPALPWEPGGFLQAYHSMHLGASEELFEKDQVGKAIYDLYADRVRGGGSPIELTSQELLTELNKFRQVYHSPNERPSIEIDKKHWPSSVQNLSSYVVRASRLLLLMGVNVYKQKRTMKAKGKWVITEPTAQHKLNLTEAKAA